jgi:hypothetical protein
VRLQRAACRQGGKRGIGGGGDFDPDHRGFVAGRRSGLLIRPSRCNVPVAPILLFAEAFQIGGPLRLYFQFDEAHKSAVDRGSVSSKDIW